MTTEAVKPSDLIDDAARARAGECADGVQRFVAARPDLAVSVVGVGLDALSTALRKDPAALLELEPYLRLMVDVFNYVTTGDRTTDLDAFLRGS